MRENLVDLNRCQEGCNEDQARTKAMCINNKTNSTLDRKEIGNTDKSPYLCSIVTKEGGGMIEVRNKISKANGTFNRLQKVQKSSDISLRTKLIIFNSNVKYILLYGCETRGVIQEIWRKL
jgi:hypothetical protein